MNISSLHHYPVKSMRGIALSEAAFDARGIVHDREFLVVDASDVFITQRGHARMALFAAEVAGATLILRGPGRAPLSIPVVHDGPGRPVQIWRDTVMAVDQGDAAAAWLSAGLEMPVRLVRMADDFARTLDPAYAKNLNDQTGFADGYPALVVCEASLDGLNERLIARGSEPLPMNRFRPNIVVGGAVPFAEDGWKRIRVGGMTFDLVKPCARCEITTTDQDTAEKGLEPLATLATFRKVNGKVMFGMNAIHAGPGVVWVGDIVEVVA
ncbi:MAG: MOSC N-terminal beta barrel domain-containing protein [Thermoflexales bacterium]